MTAMAINDQRKVELSSPVPVLTHAAPSRAGRPGAACCGATSPAWYFMILRK